MSILSTTQQDNIHQNGSSCKAPVR